MRICCLFLIFSRINFRIATVDKNCKAGICLAGGCENQRDETSSSVGRMNLEKETVEIIFTSNLSVFRRTC